MKTIALIGKPNVGKSSLFNRIIKKRVAITSDVSGTTRDIKKEFATILDRECQVIDTGGLDESNEIFVNVKKKSLEMARESDIILYLVDGKKLPDDEDREIIYEIQKLGKNIAIVINKIDNDKELEKTWEFYSFGIDTIFPISVSHNRNLNKLFQWIIPQLPEPIIIENNIQESNDDDIDLDDYDDDGEIKDDNSNEIKIAIIGRVNVGKSSILNAITGENRSVVSSIAGTTIDPVNETTIYKEKVFEFVDTAGIRRRGKIDGIEKFALLRTNDMLENADVALPILDASEKFVDLDEKIAGLVDKNGLATIVILNKWDENLMDYKKAIAEIRDRFKFLYYAPIIVTSALTGRNIDKVKDKILEIYANYSQRIPTSKLNAVIEEATRRHTLPSDHGKLVRIYYTTQYDIKPPKIALVMNRPRALHFSYKRYLVNYLRDNFNFHGSPIHFYARKKGERIEDDDIEVKN